ncbi:helix-turn-helix domain-containing protein [Nocardia sp. NBC_01730]|uniref:helix-turn-helix domain-containing protein n=1 Tax=Nocardia sp. NBC_01730 TaxID=2975998 RepID=UPI003FA35493
MRLPISCSPGLVPAVVVGGWWHAADVVRHTSFRFCLDPTVEQRMVLSRHAGAARFAFNQCL